MKKIVYIGVAFIAVVTIAAFWYFNRQAPSGFLKPAPSGPITDAPSAGEIKDGSLKTLSSQPVISYWVVGKNEVYYLSEEGKIIKINPDGGKQEEVFSQPLYDVAVVKSSPDGQEAIVGFGRPPVFSRFTVKDKSWQPLPADIAAAGWAGQKIVLIKKAPAGAAYLTIYNPEKKTETKITTLSILDADIAGESGGKIVIATKPTAFYESAILAVDAAKKTVEVLLAPAKGLAADFSGPGGQGLIYKKPSVAAVNSEGKTLGVLPFTTLPSKCGWQSKTSLICAAVTNLGKHILPDDYLKRVFYSSDEFYRVTLGETVSIEKIFSPERAADADLVSVVDNKVLFINRRTGRLYSLEL